MKVSNWALFEMDEEVVYMGPVSPGHALDEIEIGKTYEVRNILIANGEEWIKIVGFRNYYDVRMFATKEEWGEINESLSQLLN